MVARTVADTTINPVDETGETERTEQYLGASATTAIMASSW